MYPIGICYMCYIVCIHRWYTYTQVYPLAHTHTLSICYVPQSHMYAYTCKCRWDVVLWYVGIYYIPYVTKNHQRPIYMLIQMGLWYVTKNAP